MKQITENVLEVNKASVYEKKFSMLSSSINSVKNQRVTIRFTQYEKSIKITLSEKYVTPENDSSLDSFNSYDTRSVISKISDNNNLQSSSYTETKIDIMESNHGSSWFCCINKSSQVKKRIKVQNNLVSNSSRLESEKKTWLDKGVENEFPIAKLLKKLTGTEITLPGFESQTQKLRDLVLTQDTLRSTVSFYENNIDTLATESVRFDSAAMSHVNFEKYNNAYDNQRESQYSQSENQDKINHVTPNTKDFEFIIEPQNIMDHDDHGQNILHYVAQNNDNQLHRVLDLLKILVTDSAVCDNLILASRVKDHYANLPINYAIKSYNIDILKFLIEDLQFNLDKQICDFAADYLNAAPNPLSLSIFQYLLSKSKQVINKDQSTLKGIDNDHFDQSKTQPPEDVLALKMGELISPDVIINS